MLPDTACPTLWLLRPVDVTLILGAGTVTEQLEESVPNAVFAVIVADPTETALTTPLLFTVATFGLLLLHVTFLSEVVLGLIEAVNVSEFPIGIVVEVLFKDMPVARTNKLVVYALF